jgi:hypothetical protein
VFQEEALFAPLALGIVMGLAGLLLGRAARTPPLPRNARTWPQRNQGLARGMGRTA